MLARINRWTEEEKATYLAVSLKGSARTVLSNLPAKSLYSYDALVAALETRFGTAHQAELHRIRLKGRFCRRDEELPELAEDIDRPTRILKLPNPCWRCSQRTNSLMPYRTKIQG